MKTLLTAFAVLATAGAASADVKLPKGYEPIVVCAAFDGAPEFKVARKDGDFFLAAKVGKKTALFLLEGTDGDEGYNTFAPTKRSELGELDAHVGYVTLSHNEMDVGSMEEAVITHGIISKEDYRRDDQECEAIGEPFMYPSEK